MFQKSGDIYDQLIPVDIPDYKIPNYNDVTTDNVCPICDANSTCINCNPSQMCPAQGGDDDDDDSAVVLDDDDDGAVVLGLGIGLGVLLLIALVAISVFFIFIAKRSQSS